MRRFTTGTTDQYLYFVAFDSTDYVSRKTGLSGFTVYRARNGGSATAYTTPTIAEVSAANMPGVYSLLLDEDMTISSGNDSEEMAFHITVSGMVPVTEIIELYRPKLTEGETVTAASGSANAQVKGIDANQITAAAIADNAIDRATFAADTGLQTIRSNTAQAGSSGSITLDASASATDNFYNSNFIIITGGTGAGQVRRISGYTGATKVALVSPTWTTNPDNTSTFAIRAESYAKADVGFWNGTQVATPTTAGVPAVELIDISAAGMADIRTAVGLASANIDTQLSTIAGYIDTEVAAILAAVDTEIATIVTNTTGIPTANQNADALLDRAAGVETGFTLRQTLRLMASVLLGKMSGGGTATEVFRDLGDTKDRVTATVDASGNRSAVTRDAT